MKSVLAAVLLLAACSKEPSVGPGMLVVLDYELSSGGAIVETSDGREPIVVKIGAKNLPPAVEAALIGARPGEERIVEASVAQSFGEPDPAKIRTIPLAKFGAMAKDLKPGAAVSGASGGDAAEGRVVSIEQGVVSIDFNHPLAGKALTYRLKVVSISAP